MAARRAQAARAASHLASSSNLATATTGASPAVRSNNAARLKATSMTNLQASGTQQQHQSTNSLKRPASRNALDNIHKGMNAKFTHVQSKVLLQNIRPQGGGGSSKIPANNRASSPASRSGGTLQRLTPATPTSRRTGGANTPAQSVQSDRSQLINRIKALQEELAERERERDDLRQELERERADRTEQVGAAKGELEAKALEAERQSEEYHQKLIEAYELADQNRRAADTVLSESRQREDELRKKIDELESQLGELREFVTMKEEMMGKMGELREQIRVERERYEEKTRSLHQMFENEKIRLEMELMEKVKQVSESYELHKLKTQNRTIELDARLSSERLFAAKVRLHQASGENEKLSKELRSCQAQMREQEKKLMLAETMLRQLVTPPDGRRHGSLAGGAAEQPASHRQHTRQTGMPPSSRAGKFRTTTKTTSGAGGNNRLLLPSSGARPLMDQNRFLVQFGGRTGDRDSMRHLADATRPLETTTAAGRDGETNIDGGGGGQSSASDAQLGARVAEQQVAASLQRHSDIATQTSRGAAGGGGGARQPGRARTIINDLRQRLNLVGSGNAAAAAASSSSAQTKAAPCDAGDHQVKQREATIDVKVAPVGSMANKVDAAIQADDEPAGQQQVVGQSDQSMLGLFEQQRWMLEEMLEHRLLFGTEASGGSRHRRLGRPKSHQRMHRSQQQQDGARRRRSISLDAFLNQSLVREVAGEQVIISRGWPPSAISRRRRRYMPRPHSSQEGASADKHRSTRHKSPSRRPRRDSSTARLTSRPPVAHGHPAGGRRRSISVASSPRAPAASQLGELQKRQLLIEFLNSESAQNNAGDPKVAATSGGKLQAPPQGTVRRLSIISGNGGGGGGRQSNSPRHRPHHLTNVVQYELAVHPSGQLPIVLPDGRS